MQRQRVDASPTSQRTARSLAAAGPVQRFTNQPRDLGHPEAMNFLIGDPQEMVMPEYVAAIQRALVPDSPSYYAYAPPWQPAVDAVAALLGARLGMDLDPRDVFLTRGATSGLALALRVLVDPGDEVIMMSPPWFHYESMVVGELAQPVKVLLTPDTFDLDLPAIERAITGRTRLVIVNTPHNPSGRLYPADQLEGLAELLERSSQRNGRRIYLLSDESFARILFDKRPMLSPGRFYPATFMVHTYSKTLLTPSQRAGYVAMPPSMPESAQLRRALLAGSLATASFPDRAMQRAMPELERLVIDMTALERRRDRLVADLRRLGYACEPPEGTFYLFPRCPIPDAVEFCDWLSERRVYTLPGEAFERPGYFRLSLTATDGMVDRALPILAEAIGAFALGH